MVGRHVAAAQPQQRHNEFAWGERKEAIAIRGVAITPRDYILADETGVVCIPAARIDEVLDLADRIAAQEAVLEAQAINDAVASWDQV